MRKACLIALSASLLMAWPGPAGAVEPTMPTLPPAGRQAPAPAPPADGLVMDNAAPAAPTTPDTGTVVPGGTQPSTLVQFLSGHAWHAPTAAPQAACPTCCTDGNCGDNCGKRQR